MEKWSYVDKKLWLGNSNSNTLIVNSSGFSHPSPRLQDQKSLLYTMTVLVLKLHLLQVKMA